MAKYVAERLYAYLRTKNMRVDSVMKKVLNYFNKNVLVTFSASGSDSCPSEYDEVISKKNTY